MLIDSNIIIYATRLEHHAIRQWIKDNSPKVSAVSYVEVLGYHLLKEKERSLLEAFFAAAPILSISTPVLEQAVKLRQLRRMTLGDALIAGTALTHRLTLVTRNTDDFTWIAGLQLLDPFVPS